MENFICSRYGERLHILNTENMKMCLHFLPYLLNICKKWLFYFPRYCSNMPKVRWVLPYAFCSKFHTLSSSAKFWKSAKIWRSYREFNGGNFFETQCRYSLYHSATVRIIHIVFFSRHNTYNTRILLLDLTYVHIMLTTVIYMHKKRAELTG